MMSFDEDQTNVSPEGALLMNSYSNRFPLPKNWPQNVKVAVLHIFSLVSLPFIPYSLSAKDLRFDGSDDQATLSSREMKGRGGCWFSDFGPLS